MKYLKWVVMTFQAMNTCENRYFREMCTELNSKVKIIDRHTAVTKISEVAVGDQIIDLYYALLICDNWT